MKITERPIELSVDAWRVTFRRTEGGVIDLTGDDDLALAAGMGFAHAHDRMLQMMLVRVIGQGRLSELLVDADETFEIDLFMREMGFAHLAERDLEHLDVSGHAMAEAYASGVNAYLAEHGRPVELKVAGLDPEPWKIADTLLTMNLMSFIGLAQAQQDAELLIIQAIRSGTSMDRLRALFSPHLDGLDDEILAAIARLEGIYRPLLPEAIRFLGALPKVMASNAWAVSGRLSETGTPIHCCDPHLECNRLPALWYEVVMRTRDRWWVGANMPGIAGIVMGRNRDVSAGFTYGFMDMIDYFIEDHRGGRVRREDGWEDVAVRRETIHRKRHGPVRLEVRSSSRGVIETDPRVPLPDGLHLCRAWSGADGGAAASLNALRRLLAASSVGGAQKVVREMALSANWVLADRSGSIGFQQSGRLPRRSHSGLHPVLGWRDADAWRGTVPPRRLRSYVDPAEGFIASANDDVDLPGGLKSINLCQGTYRRDRIRTLLAARERHGVAAMERMQADLRSTQAARFLALLRPLLPTSPQGELLAEWDYRYDRASRAAPLFDRIHRELHRRVFAERVFGAEVWEAIVGSTAMIADFFPLFDDVILGPDDPAWFGPERRETLLRSALAAVLDEREVDALPTLGEERRVVMTNILFDGKLPGFLGLDHGPIELQGSSGSLVQCVLYRAHDRATSYYPSWRFITDLGTDEARTALAGGPSARRLSPHYTTDIERWLNHEYKTLRP